MEQPKNVVPKPQIQILGWWVNERLSYDTTINMNVGIVTKNIRNLKEITAVSDQKTKEIIANSYLLPKVLYGLPLMIGQNERIKNVIHRTIMMIARWTRNSFCFRESVMSICKSIGWDTPTQMMKKQSLKLMNKIIMKQTPKQIIEYIHSQGLEMPPN